MFYNIYADDTVIVSSADSYVEAVSKTMMLSVTWRCGVR